MSPLFLLFALSFVLRGHDPEETLAWQTLARIGVLLVLGGLGYVMGRYAKPVDPNLDLDVQHQQGYQRLTTGTFSAASLASAAAMINVALAFIWLGPFRDTVVTLVLSAVMVLLAAWPTRSRLEAVQQKLNANGGQVDLNPQPGMTG